MKTRTQSITALILISTMLASCATPGGQSGFSQGNPCAPGAESPMASFVQQAILNPLANIGGTLLATAAANYSQKYTGKLSKLLTKLVTPKQKKKRPQFDQGFGDPGFEQGQPDFNTDFPEQVDPNTGLPIQIDPNTGFPIQDPSGFPEQDDFGQTQEQIDPNTGFPIQDPSGFPGQDDFGQPQEQIDPNTGLPMDPGFVEEGEPGFGDPGEFQTFEEGIPQEEFDPTIQGDIQPRGVPGQFPHATFPSQPCDPQQQVQGYPPTNQPYGNDPAYQTGGYDPYAQQQGQNPYEQTDPYAQQGYPEDPNGQPASQQDPYAQQGSQDPYGQQSPQQDPYAQQGYPSDPNGQQGYANDPYAQQGDPQDSYSQPTTQQDPYAQSSYPQDPNTQTGYAGEGGAVGTPVGLDVVMLKKTIRNGASVMLPINDGDILKDGRGNVKAGDKFRVMFRPHTDGYVYVVAIDGSGWAQGIFPPPTSPMANPVTAGEEYVLPEGNNWFSLDQFKGIETIFFIASQEKRQDLEEIVRSITGHERPAAATPQQVTKVAMVPYGVGGAHPSAQGFNLSVGSGPDQTIMPTSYFSKTAGEDLRLTRWFRHE